MKRLIDDETLVGLADALRKVTGKNRTYTPQEMIEEVTTIMEAATYILVDEDGIEIPAVFVANEPILTATPNDIRIGTTAVTSDGIVEGEKEIPAYHTEQGRKIIKPGQALAIPMYSNQCQYTGLNVIICKYATSTIDSVSAVMVVVNDKLYAVNSTTVLAEVTVDITAETIKLGIINDSDTSLLIRYMTYKEEP